MFDGSKLLFGSLNYKKSTLFIIFCCISNSFLSECQGFNPVYILNIMHPKLQISKYFYGVKLGSS